MVNFADILAPKFDETKKYSVREFVIYSNKFYISVQSTGPGAFVPEHWLEAWAVDLLGQDPFIVTGKVYAFPIITNGSATYDVSKYVPEGVTPKFFVGVLYDDPTQLYSYSKVSANSDYEVGTTSYVTDAGTASYDAASKKVTHTLDDGTGSNSGRDNHHDDPGRPYSWEHKWTTNERLFMVVDAADQT